MKTEWKYEFETEHLIFCRDHIFNGTATPHDAGKRLFDKHDRIQFELKLTPNHTNDKNRNKAQRGHMYLTIPLTYEDGKEVASHLAYVLAERITFDFGAFRLLNSIVECRRIPETPEEKAVVGDNIYAFSLRLVEVKEHPVFDSREFSEKSNERLDIRLVSQYNAAKEATNSIDKFLGYFKIIESMFGRSGKSLKQSFDNSDELFNLYVQLLHFETPEKARIAYSGFIEATVKTRHRCAHLRSDNKFGYTPADSGIREEVEPLLYPLERLAYLSIKRIPGGVEGHDS